MIKKTHTKDLRENTLRWQATVREREDSFVSDDELPRAQNAVILSIVHCCMLSDCRFRFNRCVMFESKTFIFLLIQNNENKLSSVKRELSFFVQYT